MIITKQGLATIAERFLEALEEESISSLELALASNGKRIRIKEIILDYLHIRTTPSNQGTTALKMSYACPRFEGVPLEVVINSALGYKQIIAKCSEAIPRYAQFTTDDYGNGVYFKKSAGADWNDAIREVMELSKL